MNLENMDLDSQNWNQCKFGDLQFRSNTSSENAILEHLSMCNDSFVPPLSSYVEVEKYVLKLFTKAQRLEVWDKNLLVGLLAYYKEETTYFISNFSLIPKYQGMGIAQSLFKYLANTSSVCKDICVKLEVQTMNDKAITFYKKMGFLIIETKENTHLMIKNLL